MFFIYDEGWNYYCHLENLMLQTIIRVTYKLTTKKLQTNYKKSVIFERYEVFHPESQTNPVICNCTTIKLEHWFSNCGTCSVGCTQPP